jgi:putative methyltransferase (TIGR04325 family)
MRLKDILPPILTELAKKHQSITTYKNFEEALAYCSQDAYQNGELCNMIADKTLAYVKSLKTKPYHLNPTSVYLAFALNYYASTARKFTITVLDFGGACGAHYFEVRNLIPPGTSLNWVVVETEQMIKSAQSRGFETGEVSFVPEIGKCNMDIDFIYSSSALQYVPAPYRFLQELINVGAKMILFNRMMFNQNNYDFITVQRSSFSANGPGKLPQGYTDRPVKYPHTTMSNTKMNSLMADGGYECFSEFDEPSGKLSLGKENILGKGMLFVQKAFLPAALPL